MTARRSLPILCLVLGLGLASPAAGQAPPPAAQSADATVRALYDLVSADAGSTPDWDAVRAAFLPEAVVVLRTSLTAMKVFDLEGFIQDFVTFYATPDVVGAGFRETVLASRATEVGDMAQVWVLYEARIPGGRGNQGVDAFLLVKRDGAWRIAAVTNEVPTPARPVPEGLFD